jgi:hypothetical protein
MKSSQKFWFVLVGAVLGMALIACSCGSFVPRLPRIPALPGIPTLVGSLLGTSAPPATSAPLATSTPQPTDEPLPFDTPLPTFTPPPLNVTQEANPLPALAGYWQTGAIVFTIEWQGGRYAVTAINASGTSTRTLEEQSWDGSSLTWTYTYADENGSSSITYSTATVEGDTLTAYRSTASGGPDMRLLRRVPSPMPVYDSLPHADDFSNPESGWEIYDTDTDSAGYVNQSYFVISRTNEFSSFGTAGLYLGDTIIDVDANPVSGPADNNYSYNVGCRNQANFDGYVFEIRADGYFAVGYFTDGGQSYVSLLSGDDWQPSPAIMTGVTVNHMRLTCSGSQLRLVVNGQLLYEGQDSTFSEGDISLGAATYTDDSTPAEVHFDNLVVNLP